MNHSFNFNNKYSKFNFHIFLLKFPLHTSSLTVQFTFCNKVALA